MSPPATPSSAAFAMTKERGLPIVADPRTRGSSAAAIDPGCKAAAEHLGSGLRAVLAPEVFDATQDKKLVNAKTMKQIVSASRTSAPATGNRCSDVAP